MIATTVFSPPPNWGAASVKVQRQFKTDIITSRSGKEQRRALRNRARKTVEFTTTALAAPDYRALQRLLLQQLNTLLLPDWSRGVALASSAASGAATIAVAALPTWAVAGATVILTGPSGATEAQAILTVSPTSITFSAPLAGAWSAGTILRPGLQGRMAMSLKATHMADTRANLEVHFDVQPTTEPELAAPAATTVFNGREVFLTRPNWSSDITSDLNAPFETLDFAFGAIGYYNPIAFTTAVNQAVFLSLTPAETSQIEHLFERMKGQRGEFYAPTWDSDMVLRQGQSASDVQIRVVGQEVYYAYRYSTVYKAVCIALNSGATIFAQVSQMTLVGDASGLDTVFTLPAALGTGFALSDVAQVCWMPARRLASDTLTTEWLTDQAAQIQMNIQTIEDLPSESL